MIFYSNFYRFRAGSKAWRLVACALTVTFAVFFHQKPAMSQMPVNEWQLRLEDKTLQTAVKRWADDAYWKLIWDTPVDYPIEEASHPYKSINEALKWTLEDAFQKGISLQATFYTQNRILRIHPVVPN